MSANHLDFQKLFEKSDDQLENNMRALIIESVRDEFYRALRKASFIGFVFGSVVTWAVLEVVR